MVGFCEHGDEPSSSIKEIGFFLEKLNDSFSNNIRRHGVS
jgi:hypothetical protein